MKKQFLLAGVALSLFLLGYGILWPNSSAAMPMPLETPILTIDKEVAEELVTDLDGDGKVDPGDTISYTITYSNTGVITATNVILVDNYDETLIENVTNITGGGRDDGNVITWELGDLAGGDGDLVRYEARLKETLPPGTTVLENEASICSNEVEPIRAAQTVRVQRPELTITKASEEIDLDEDGVMGAGDIIKYEITYENKGEAAAANVVVVDDYDETLIASIDNISGDGDDDGSAITWMLGTVKAGAKGSLTYEVTLKSKFPAGTTSVDNTAEITSDETYPDRATASVPIEVPNLTIFKERAPGLINDLNDNGKPDPGDTVKFDIAYENRGDADATEVIIADNYDETAIKSIAKITGDGKDDGDTITWELDRLAAGAPGSVSYEATLKETFPVGSTDVQNQVAISSKQTEPTSATETVRVEVVPTPPPTPPRETSKENILEKQPQVGWMIFGTGLFCLVGLIGTALIERIKTSDEEASRRVRLVQEGVCVVLIAVIVAILRLTNCIEEEGTVSILSGIIGYVLGRTVGKGT